MCIYKFVERNSQFNFETVVTFSKMFDESIDWLVSKRLGEYDLKYKNIKFYFDYIYNSKFFIVDNDKNNLIISFKLNEYREYLFNKINNGNIITSSFKFDTKYIRKLNAESNLPASYIIRKTYGLTKSTFYNFLNYGTPIKDEWVIFGLAKHFDVSIDELVFKRKKFGQIEAFNILDTFLEERKEDIKYERIENNGTYKYIIDMKSLLNYKKEFKEVLSN